MTPFQITRWAIGATGLALTCAAAARPVQDVVCSLAPSQSKVITGVSAAAGGAAATTAAVASALGLTWVAHSSGALILAGSGGYIAGTLGTAIVAPVVIGVGIFVGGAALSVEVLCAPKNHPEGSRKVVEAAREFRNRTGTWLQAGKTGATAAARNASSKGRATLTLVKGHTASLYRRAFKRSASGSAEAT